MVVVDISTGRPPRRESQATPTSRSSRTKKKSSPASAFFTPAEPAVVVFGPHSLSMASLHWTFSLSVKALIPLGTCSPRRRVLPANATPTSKVSLPAAAVGEGVCGGVCGDEEKRRRKGASWSGPRTSGLRYMAGAAAGWRGKGQKRANDDGRSCEGGGCFGKKGGKETSGQAAGNDPPAVALVVRYSHVAAPNDRHRDYGTLFARSLAKRIPHRADVVRDHAPGTCPALGGPH